MKRSSLDDMRAHYARADEAGRLEQPVGVVEFERSKEIIQRALPPPPATVADIGGGPGRYALWLADLGYTVEHRDLMSMHVEHVQAHEASSIHSEVGDARDLDLGEGSVDAVLMLGPLYHLTEHDDRLQALREAARITRPDGVVFLAAISRWAPRLDGDVVQELSLEFPHLRERLPETESGGRLEPLHDAGFCGYTHRPDELAAEVVAAGLQLIDLVGVEGMSFALSDLAERLADPTRREVVFAAAGAIERVPELLGLSPHLLATARRSAT
jgi:SAM-dependent methyltransferase